MKLSCIKCDKELESVFGNIQPIDGLAFASQGHYGTTFFDPMDGSHIEICVCDECLNAADKAGNVHRSPHRIAEPDWNAWK